MINNWISFVFFPFIILLFAKVIGCLIKPNIKNWYIYLIKPPLNPPIWFFAPAWTLIYTLIGVSGGYAYTVDEYGFSEEKDWAWICYFFGLGLNFSWCFIFFQLNLMFFACLQVSFMVMVAGLTILSLYSVSPISAYFYGGYGVFLLVATYLTWGVWILNRKRVRSENFS